MRSSRGAFWRKSLIASSGAGAETISNSICCWCWLDSLLPLEKKTRFIRLSSTLSNANFIAAVSFGKRKTVGWMWGCELVWAKILGGFRVELFLGIQHGVADRGEELLEREDAGFVGARGTGTAGILVVIAGRTVRQTPGPPSNDSIWLSGPFGFANMP